MQLQQNEIIDIFTAANVIQRGHFLLTSGRHGDTYMQCAHLFERPQYGQRLCAELAVRFTDEKIDVVIGPATGGIIIAYEMARQLGVRNIFAERENETMTLRRGFSLQPDERVLVVEDVTTTGGSVFEVIELVKRAGGIVIGVGTMVDRSNGAIRFGVRQEAVLTMAIKSYAPEECPLCKDGKIQLHRPGGRACAKR